MKILIYRANLTRTFKTKYQPPTGGTTEQEIMERFPAFSMPGRREKGGHNPSCHHGEPCAGADCHAGRGRESLFTACLDERASTGVFEKTSRGRERGVIPLEQRAHLYTLAGVCALPRAYLRTGNFPRAPIWRLCRNKGLHPLRRFAAIPAHPQKQYTRPGVCTIFAGFIILSGR